MDFLTCKSKYLQAQALIMWVNYIETGNVNMSAQTAIKCGRKSQVNILSDDQMRLVLRLKEEFNNVLNK